MEGEGTSQPEEQLRAASPQRIALRSASPPPQRKKSSPLSTEEGGESVESIALVKRKRIPAGQSPVVVAGEDDEIIDLTMGREKEKVTEDEEDVEAEGMKDAASQPKKKKS
ncbi:hypothetical protein Dimus_001030 [Dionaea muscipula]